GGFAVTAFGRALTHHSMNGANNVRDAKAKGIHVRKLAAARAVCQSRPARVRAAAAARGTS
ncbi:hypothetical protein, partial [Pseudomonas sp. 32_A]|uniref:hypothetical protein n=1 Tax=Pseudomonas sp. 32_A TaxID=2813559 RepID=UPI001A9DC862